MDRATFEAQLRTDGFDEVLNRRVEASEPPPLHTHDFDARLLMLEGEFVLEQASTTSRYGPGEIFEIPDGTPHAESFGSSGAAYVARRRRRLGMPVA